MLARRLKEPSTWAGFAVLLNVFGINLAPEILTPAIQGLTGFAGVAAVLMGEKR
jgi:hypothetical protein